MNLKKTARVPFSSRRGAATNTLKPNLSIRSNYRQGYSFVSETLWNEL